MPINRLDRTRRAYCDRCEGSGWVCEQHPDQRFMHAVECFGPGEPCPRCQPALAARPDLTANVIEGDR